MAGPSFPRSAFQSALPILPSSTFGAKRVVVRVDPSLMTCFDPSDKELYDLWAPKR